MRALTLTEPYASLIARGVKRLETRPMATSYRGPLAIHAANGFSPLRALGYPGTLAGMEKMILDRPDLLAACQAAGDGPGGTLAGSVTVAHAAGARTREPVVYLLPFMLALGKIVAVAELVNCMPTGGSFLKHGYHVGPYEYACGDYLPGRFAWVLANVRPVEPLSPRDEGGRHPFARGLWSVPEEVVSNLCYLEASERSR